MTHENKIDGIPVVPKPSRDILNQKELEDYRTHKELMIKWLLNLGKNPERAEGYSASTLKRSMNRIDQFYRWVWNDNNGYTKNVTHDHANDFVEDLAYSDRSNSDKKKFISSLKRLFKWREHQFGQDQWEPERTFPTTQSQPQDYFTLEERSKLREAALQYDTIPKYNDLSPEQRSRWKSHIAQKLGKKKSLVEPSDWEEVNSWKITSMICVSLDAGFRPSEVENAKISWIDTDNGVLRIPKDQSSKNRENWTVALRDSTANYLQNWLEERETKMKYDDRDELWLTREGNPYQSQSLRYVLKKLCGIADIEFKNRSLSWYSIRHSTGTYMTNERGLAATKSQLRHKSETTTMKYDQTPVEQRRDALDKMG